MTRYGSGVDEDGFLHIRYPNGRMRICLWSFFPCGPGRLRKLMKVVDMDCERAECARELLGYLTTAYNPESWRESLKEYANMVVDGKTDIREMEEEIERMVKEFKDLQERAKKLPRGDMKKRAKAKTEEEKAKIKKKKEVLRDLKSHVSWANGQFIKKTAAGKKYEQNIALIRELSAGWI